MLHLSSPPTTLQIAERDQLGRFVPLVEQSICDFRNNFPGLPAAVRQSRVVTLQVSSNDFSKGRAWVVFGSLTLVSGVDFKVGGSASQVASGIAAALKAAGISAAASGSSVQVVAPQVDQPFPVTVCSSGGTQNFNVLPEGGFPLPGPYDPPDRIHV